MRSSRRSSPSRFGIVALVPGLLLALALAACGGGGTPSPSAGVTVSDAWVRLPAGMSTATAAYLTITGGTQADALTGASSSIADMVGIHETTTDASGMSGMHPVDRIEVPAGATVKLEPGGYHVMFEGLSVTLAAGQKVEIELTFEHAGEVVVTAEVRAG